VSLLTCHVALSWADDAMRATAASYGLKITGRRVTLAAERILLDQPVVTAAELVRGNATPFFTVALGTRRDGPPQWRDPVVMVEGWLNGVFTAWTVLRNDNVDRLEPVDMRLRFEVIG